MEEETTTEAPESMDLAGIINLIAARRVEIDAEVAKLREQREAINTVIKALLAERDALPRAPVKRERKPKEQPPSPQ